MIRMQLFISILLAAMLGSALSARAGNPDTVAGVPMPVKLLKIAPRTSARMLPTQAGAAKTTVANLRLIAVAGRLMNFSPGGSYTNIDSMRYTYSGTRGTGLHDTIARYLMRDGTLLAMTRQAIVYDTTSLQWLESATLDSLPGGQTTRQHLRYTRSRQGNDSVFEQELLDLPTMTFLPSLRYRSSFTTAGLVQQVTVGKWDVDSQRYIGRFRSTYSYDPTGRMTMRFEEERDPSLSLAVPDTQAFIPDRRTSWAYDARGNITMHLEESTFSGPLLPFFREFNQYHSNDKLLRQRRQTFGNGVWSTQDSSSNSFDAAGNPVLMEYVSFSGGVPAAIKITGSGYDAGNRLIFRADSTQSIGGSVWYRGYRDWYHFDAAGRQRGHHSQRGDRSGWYETDSATMSYNAGGKPQFENHWVFIQGAWEQDLRNHYLYSAGNLDDSIITQTYDPSSQTFSNLSLNLSTYNSFRLPTMVMKLSWNGTGWEFRPENGVLRYYYEAYEDGVSLSATAPSKRSTLIVYPSPATGSIRLQFPADAPALLRASILNACGQQVRVWQEHCDILAAEPISVGNLPPGRYYMTLDGGGFRAAQSFLILR